MRDRESGEIHARLRSIRMLAAVLVALSLLVVLVSAYIRLKGAGLGCSPWPECYGRVLSSGDPPAAPAARILHRSAASLALLLGFIMLWRCIRPTLLEGPHKAATALLALMIALTLVGVFSASPQRVWAGFFNILGGASLALLATATYLRASVSSCPRPKQRTGLLHAGLGVLALTVAVGALIGARYAGIACPGLPGCGVGVELSRSVETLNPFATTSAPLHFGDAGGVLLHLLHRGFALICLGLLGAAGLRALALPSARPIAAVMLVILVVQFILGIKILLSGFDLSVAVAHNLGAALLLAAGTALLLQLRRVA